MNQVSNTKTPYDLEERTAKFGESIILFCKNIQENSITRSLISQIVRSGTSIGANYGEANNAVSKKDFRNKIHIVKKEAQETKHCLRMISTAVPEQKDSAKIFWKECQELTMIFQKIASSLKNEN